MKYVLTGSCEQHRLWSSSCCKDTADSGRELDSELRSQRRSFHTPSTPDFLHHMRNSCKRGTENDYKCQCAVRILFLETVHNMPPQEKPSVRPADLDSAAHWSLRMGPWGSGDAGGPLWQRPLLLCLYFDWLDERAGLVLCCRQLQPLPICPDCHLRTRGSKNELLVFRW